jgi:hypothetical protein
MGKGEHWDDEEFSPDPNEGSARVFEYIMVDLYDEVLAGGRTDSLGMYKVAGFEIEDQGGNGEHTKLVISDIDSDDNTVVVTEGEQVRRFAIPSKGVNHLERLVVTLDGEAKKVLNKDEDVTLAQSLVGFYKPKEVKLVLTTEE